MTTLREEVKRDVPAWQAQLMLSENRREFAEGVKFALRDYGDYEIVEGCLHIHPARAKGDTHTVCVQEGTGKHITIGPCGDHIKILVPPRKEKERSQPSETLALALRENHMRLALEDIISALMHPNTESAALINIARRALEEKEDDSR